MVEYSHDSSISDLLVLMPFVVIVVLLLPLGMLPCVLVIVMMLLLPLYVTTYYSIVIIQ